MNGHTHHRLRARLPWAALVLAVVLAMTLVGTSLAAQPGSPLRQSKTDATPILLGEYVYRLLEIGDVVAYQIEAPEAGDYMLSPVDSDEAAAFDITITDAAGTVVLEDAFDELDVALAVGRYTLTFTAVDDGILTFFVLSDLGNLSKSLDAPGKLYPGGVVVTQSRTATESYGTLVIPPLPFAQEVLLYISLTDPEDVVLLDAAGEDIGAKQVYSDQTDFLRFWTHGGEYQITALPQQRDTEFVLITYLSGPSIELFMDEAFDDTLEADQDEVVYMINLDQFYQSLTIDLISSDDDADLDLRVVDRLYESYIYGSSTETISTEQVTLENLVPGVYYISITRFGEGAAEFTVVASGVVGQPLITLESGASYSGELPAPEGDEGVVAYFKFTVAEAGSLIAVALVSVDEDVTFDLGVGRLPGDNTWTSYSGGAAQALSFVATTAGDFYVEVAGTGDGGEFSLVAEDLGLAEALAVNDLVKGTVDAGAVSLYRLTVTDPGSLLTLILLGQDQVDIDLRATQYDSRGQSVHYLSSTTLGPTEIVSQADAAVGTYEVSIRSYASISTDFYVLTRVEYPAELLTTTLTVINNSAAEICSVAASAPGEADFIELMELDELLTPGSQMAFTLRADYYDLEAWDCDERLFSSEEDVFLSGSMTWTLTE